MDDRLREACCREFEHGVLRCVEMLFENAVKIPGTGLAEAPVIGTRFITALDHSVLLPMVCRALCAREKFRQQAPEWPELPLREDDIEEMVTADDVRHNVVGMFGDSQRGEYWRPDHPPFGAFVSGLMACRHTPIKIRTAPELREFPPAKLKGIAGGWLTWRAPETLALDRKMRKMTAAYEARVAASLIA